MTSGRTAPVFTLEELRQKIDGKLEGPADLRIRGVAGLDEAGEGDLTFLANPKYRPALETTAASAVLAADGVECPSHLAVIRTPDPYAALMRVVHLFDPGLPDVPVGSHPTAVVAEDAELGPEVGLGPHVVVEAGAKLGARTRIAAGGYVGPGAVLGDDCYLYPHVFVGRGSRLGHRVHVQAGAIIGSDGFGYAPVDGAYRKIPQIGIVEIGDDVEIGANACIDRATLGRTRIGPGTKIDNLVQIAHNVAIAENGAVASQTGIAGSTRIGRGVRLGGQAGINGHIRIGDGVTVGAQAGVIGDVADGQTVSGYPARPHPQAMRVEASVRKLPELIRRVRALEARVEELRADGSRKERGST